MGAIHNIHDAMDVGAKACGSKTTIFLLALASIVGIQAGDSVYFLYVKMKKIIKLIDHIQFISLGSGSYWLIRCTAIKCPGREG